MLKIRWNVSWLFGILLGIGVILTLVLPGDIPWREEEAELFRAALAQEGGLFPFGCSGSGSESIPIRSWLPASGRRAVC